MTMDVGYIIREAELSLQLLVARTKAQQEEIAVLKTRVAYLNIIIKQHEQDLGQTIT